MSVKQSQFPESWADDCDGKHSRVEVSVRPETTPGTLAPLSEFEWIEIPTSHVETWSSKDNNVSIKRTTKVQFPTEWDGESVREVVKGFGTSDIVFGRVSHKNDEGDFVQKHVGYIGGVGGGSNPIESKAWIYDFSELLKAVPINESLTNPSIPDVTARAAEIILNNTQIPLTDLILLPPTSEDSFAVSFTDEESFPKSNRTYYSVSGDVSGEQLTDVNDVESEIIDTGFNESSAIAVGGITGLVTSILVNELKLGAKKFRANRDTLYDFLNWLQSRSDITWHFEPSDGGAALIFDVLPSSRTFAQQRVVDEMNGVIDSTDPQEFELAAPEDTYRVHDTITVEENDVLYDINPVNTVLVLGDTKRSVLEGNVSLDGVTQLYSPLAEKDFPVVKARADPLYQAADKTEQLMETVESDAQDIGQAKTEAKVALKKAISESTEGKIRCLGNPYIKPYDTLDAFETCGDYIIEEPLPVRYEVQSVKHEEDMTGLYRMFLNVTIHVSDDEFSFPLETVKKNE